MVTIGQIVEASEKRNGGRDGANAYALGSMKGHAEEIEGFFMERNPHWKAECADMIIHCLCLFRREGVNEMEVLELIEKRKERFMERIGEKD